jgi:hypothetical protein
MHGRRVTPATDRWVVCHASVTDESRRPAGGPR